MKISRRNTLLSASAAAATCSLIPGKVLGANDKVNVACVGMGGRANQLLPSFPSDLMNVVAVCDVNLEGSYRGNMLNRYSEAKQFQDFRKMFDKMAKEIDAVIVCLPDHSHFPVSMMAMALGKHVYVEKPMAHTFQEAQLMMEAEKKYKIVTQMGNQGHSGTNYFQFKAWVEAGIIKDVTHVDAFMNLKRRWHPWGKISSYPKQKKPKSMDWDIWNSTVKMNPYSDKLDFGNWRGWFDYGTGCFGDWGAHVLDTIHQFLDLGLPTTITAKKLKSAGSLLYPKASTINFAFPKRGNMPAMDINWYDGTNNLPPVPKGGSKSKKPGKFIYSKKYTFQGGHHSEPLRIIPDKKMKELLKKGALPKNFGKHSSHYANFLLACKGDEKTRSPFSIAGPLTQVLTLGCIAQQFGGKLKFDRKKMIITNKSKANAQLARTPRKGWEQYYKI